MCGICGVVQVGGRPRPVLARGVIDRMTDVMEHRGPNDRGTHQADGIALGARRLSIVDVVAGHQPFANEDGTIWAVQNGELYNHDEIRGDLRRRGHTFETRCDTEILPHLYEAEGERLPERLRGKYAVAVWDGVRRRAVVARDRLGIKPLYHAQVGDLVLFASELKGLLASGLIELELDYDAIDAFLTLGFVPGPATPLQGVSKLQPGHRLVVDPSGVRVEPYWSFPEPTGDWRGSEDEAAAELLERLEDAVRMRLMSDVPLGAMLSGGLDSSLIVALMARNMSEPVKTFSVGFAEAGDSNELDDARRVAEFLGAEHRELELSVADADVDVADLVWYLDEPLADLSALGFLALSELAAQHVTVALSGQGADELLGGYGRYRNAALADRWRRVPGAVRRPLERAALHGPARLRRKAGILAAGDPRRQVVEARKGWTADLRARLATGPLAEQDGLAVQRAVAGRLGAFDGDALSTTLYLDGQLNLVDDMLHYFDRASMAHSLEVRVPFLDHELVEFCARLPASLKVHRLTTKYLLKKAARGLVPDFVVDKRKIGFFSSSVGTWMGSQMNDAVADYLLAPNPRYADFLDRNEVRALLVRSRSGTTGQIPRLLLSILMLEVWLSTYLPRAIGGAAEAQLAVVAS